MDFWINSAEPMVGIAANSFCTLASGEHGFCLLAFSAPNSQMGFLRSLHEDLALNLLEGTNVRTEIM